MADGTGQPGGIQVLGAAVLARRCQDVVDFGERTHQVAEVLRLVLRGRPDGIGLAANQAGIGTRAFVWDLRPAGEDFTGVVYNPQVVDHRGAVTDVEGCLSIPGLYWPVTRHARVTVTGQDAEGDEVVVELDGLAARLFQHEIDHLDGVLLLDRVDGDERRAMEDELARVGWTRVGRHWLQPRPET